MLDRAIAEKRLVAGNSTALTDSRRHADAVLVPRAVLPAGASRKDLAIPANGLVSRQSASWFSR